MKGKLHKTEQGWVVSCFAEQSGDNIWVNTYPLHPDHIEMMDTCFTSKFSHEVEFEIVTEWNNGEVGVNGLTYAKLLHHSVDTNEMIDHIGEVNEMVDHVPDVRKMVEDDVEKLAEREYREFPSNPKDKTDWLYNRDVNCFKKRKAFIKGYNKAKETLYTKEELMDAIRLARQIVYKIGANDYCNTDEEIIQSLKQPKP